MSTVSRERMLFFHLLVLTLLFCAKGERYITRKVSLGDPNNASTVINGEVSSIVTWRLALELQHEEEEEERSSQRAIRVSTSSSAANLSFPLLISVRQGRHISSWTLPFIEAGHAFPEVSKTLCPILNRPLHDNSTHHIIYIDISTPSLVNISFNFSAHIVTDYQLRMDSPINNNVHASSPLSYVFEYPDDVDRVLVKVTSNSNLCALVSVQEGLCPVDQLLDYPDHRGTFQTMQLLAAINMKRPVHQNFVYIVISMYHHDNCSETNHDFIDGLVTLNTSANYDPVYVHNIDELMEYSKTVTIEIDHTLPIYRYWIAVGVSLCVLVLFAALMLLCSFVDGILCYRQHPVCQLLESGGCVAAVTPEDGGGEVGVTSLTGSEGLVKRPDFLSVLKGDYWYYQYKKRTTPSPRSPNFINNEFKRALRAPPGHASNQYGHDQRPLMLPSIPSDASFSCNEECSGVGGCGHKSLDMTDNNSVISSSSVDVQMRLLDDFSDMEGEEEEGGLVMVMETRFSTGGGGGGGRGSRKVSGRKRDLSIVLEDTESLSHSSDDNHKQEDLIEEEEEEEENGESIESIPYNNTVIPSELSSPSQSSLPPQSPPSQSLPLQPSLPSQSSPSQSSLQKSDFTREFLVLRHKYLHELPIPEGEEFQKKYKGYWMYLSIIVVFYSLPVYQLMLTYQRFLSVSGNEDFCYYNSLCSHPLFGLSAFNNVWSNVSFFVLGLLFIIIARRRRSMYRVYESINKDCEKNETDNKIGVPQCFGIYYAAGVALIGEAIMSAAYHICPTGNNYQFDTTMMFVLVTLGLYQLFKSRNPDVTPQPHQLLFILSLLILFIAFGVIYNGLAFYILFFLIFEFGVAYTSLQVYYRWKLQFSKGFIVLKELWYNMSHPFPPQHKPKALYSCISVVFNMLFGSYGLLLQPVDFATYFLSIMIGNFIMSLIYYVVTKIYYQEFGQKKAVVKSLACLVLAILFWVGGALMYSVAVTDWLKSPAGSRDGNSECLVLGFYDSHDLWHFLSSFALFFSFLLLMTLDDNQEVVDRSKIHIF